MLSQTQTSAFSAPFKKDGARESQKGALLESQEKVLGIKTRILAIVGEGSLWPISHLQWKMFVISSYHHFLKFQNYLRST